MASTHMKVSHNEPSDLVLNTAQMRDAIHMQRFRIPSEELDAEHIIMVSAAQEVQIQQAKVRNTASAALKAGNGRGKPVGVGQARRLVAIQNGG